MYILLPTVMADSAIVVDVFTHWVLVEMNEVHSIMSGGNFVCDS